MEHSTPSYSCTRGTSGLHVQLVALYVDNVDVVVVVIVVVDYCFWLSICPEVQ